MLRFYFDYFPYSLLTHQYVDLTPGNNRPIQPMRSHMIEKNSFQEMSGPRYPILPQP